MNFLQYIYEKYYFIDLLMRVIRVQTYPLFQNWSKNILDILTII